MKRRTRRMLFWFAVLVFGVASFVIIRYAQGYKYDFSTYRFVRTGALAVTANTDAKLFVDDRLVGSLSFLGHRAGNEGLLPGTYTVQLMRDGYSSWKKDVQVSEGLLTDFPSVFIVPTDEESLVTLRVEASTSLADALTLADATPLPSPAPRRRPTPTPTVISDVMTLRGTQLWHADGTASGSLIAEQVLGFQLTKNNDRVAWWTRNEVWVLWLRSTDYQPFRSEDDREMVGRWSTPVTGAAWFHDSDHVIVDLGRYGYRIVELDQRGGTNTIRF